MTTQQLTETIKDWELDFGESFPDYFMHDNVNDQSWAFFLLGKGYVERANQIIDEILKGNKCIDQELLYEVYPMDNWTEEQHSKNVSLWAEFLVSVPYYMEKVTKFLEENS